MKNKLYKILLTSITTVVLVLPAFVLAAPGNSFEKPIVPNCTRAGVNGGTIHACGYTDLILLGINVMNFAVYLMALLSVVSFVYAGYLYMSSGGDSGALKHAREIFTKVALGIFFTLGAWLIVHQITEWLGVVDKDFTLLQ
jgi:hypothetical protein